MRKLIILMLLLAGCTAEPDAHKAAAGMTAFTVSLKTADTRASTINVDKTSWEDRVDQLRMVMFGDKGAVLFNRSLSFPNGFNKPSAPVRMPTGTYDILFVTNETVGGSDFAAALRALKQESELTTNTAYANLPYDPDFTPDGTTEQGRFVMSALYHNVALTDVFTLDAPRQLHGPILVRALTKVHVVFRKKEAGGSVPADRIGDVQLLNVAANYTAPALNDIYAGNIVNTKKISTANFDYSRDSLGAVTFYIPELLRAEPSDQSTILSMGGHFYPLVCDDTFGNMASMGRPTAGLSKASVVRNYEYDITVRVNSVGGVEIETSVVPWNKSSYNFVFQAPGRPLALPPLTVPPGGGSVIFPTPCGGSIEMKTLSEALTGGLQGAYNDQVIWWDPTISGPRIQKGSPPFYCEQKYGSGWRLINSCELMAYLSMFDQAYRMWQSNTWQGENSGLPYYSANMRKRAQDFLGKITGYDMSAWSPSDLLVDSFGAEKLNIIDQYITPGDVMPTRNEYPVWPYPSPPSADTADSPWYPMETVNQIRGYWYAGYLNYSDPANYDKILYEKFTKYSFSSTFSRCVRNASR